MIEANRTMRQPTAAQAAATVSRGARQAIALRVPSVRTDPETAGQSLAGSGALVFEGEVLELPVLH
jgi:hypothetical protein